MAFGQTFATFVAHKWAMVIGGDMPIESAEKEKLAGGRDEQVLPADHLGDLHQMIIDHAGKLVTGQIVMTPDHEIAEIATSNIVLRAKGSIFKTNRFAIRNSETPTNFCVSGDVSQFPAPAGAGVDRFFLPLVGRLQGAEHVLS